MRTKRVSLRREFSDPVFEDLSVADCAQAAEKLAGDFAHLGPGGVGVDFFHDGGERAAAANDDAEIVDGVGLGGMLQTFELFQDAIHPVGETAVFGLCAWVRRNRDQ